jgi:hypothetical protein
MKTVNPTNPEKPTNKGGCCPKTYHPNLTSKTLNPENPGSKAFYPKSIGGCWKGLEGIGVDTSSPHPQSNPSTQQASAPKLTEEWRLRSVKLVAKYMVTDLTEQYGAHPCAFPAFPCLIAKRGSCPAEPTTQGSLNDAGQTKAAGLGGVITKPTFLKVRGICTVTHGIFLAGLGCSWPVQSVSPHHKVSVGVF